MSSVLIEKPRASLLLPIWTLFWRELICFYRDRGRILGALAPPIVFWFLIGSGLGASFQIPGTSGGINFLQYFFSGTLVLIVLFTSVFSTISIIEDRREGFLQSVLVAPIPRLSIVLGKVLGASAVGFLQGLVFLVFAQTAGLKATPAGYALAAFILLLCSVGLTGMGFCIAWKLDSGPGFHSVMNLFLIPMWMLSGALFPVSTAPNWLRLIVGFNPVAYAVAGLQQALSPGAALSQLAPMGTCLLILTAFDLMILAAAAWTASAREPR
jgi:ABC-2 type transport system permease protein